MSAKTTGSYKGNTAAGTPAAWFTHSSNSSATSAQWTGTSANPNVAKPYEVVVHCKGANVGGTHWIGNNSGSAVTGKINFSTSAHADIIANAALGALRSILDTATSEVDDHVKRVFVHFEME